jgi:hypothetical protein
MREFQEMKLWRHPNPSSTINSFKPLWTSLVTYGISSFDEAICTKTSSAENLLL